MKLTIANAKAIKYACLKFHYAKSIPVNTFGINVYNDAGEWCGVVLYGTGANYHIGSEYGLPQGQCIELVRVALNGKQKKGSCTSQVVAQSLKFLKEHCPLVRLVVSYADCDQNHLGTIYQATNWIYVGVPSVDFKGTKNNCYIVNGKKTHKKSLYWVTEKYGVPLSLEALRKYVDPKAEIHFTKGKRKYLMPLDKSLRKGLEKLRKPYPKEAGWKKKSRKEFRKMYGMERTEGLEPSPSLG